jgi:hypothetical protein
MPSADRPDVYIEAADELGLSAKSLNVKISQVLPPIEAIIGDDVGKQ